jgi:UDP-N-acetyl-2-amino-2-deoxyglucuronate dehydrogenase
MKIGLMGCGRIASDHMMVYQQIGKVNVTAVCDINMEKAKQFATKFRVDKAYSSPSDLLESKDFDFIDVCTPPSTHANIVKGAAKSGHNILLEKPMALNTAECDEMIHDVKKNSVSLCICHNQIFFPAIRQAKQLIDSGHYDLLSFRTSIKENPLLHSIPAWNTSAEERGIVWEVGCHPAYLHLHLLGDIKEVYAIGNKVRYPVYDEFSVLLRTSGKAYGIVEVSWLAKETEKVYEVDSADGKRMFMIAPPPYAAQGYELLTEKSGVAEGNLASQLKKTFKYFIRTKTPLGYYIGHFNLISSYIKSLADNSPPPVKPEEGKKTVKLLECIEQSLNSRKAVQVS